ncbi:cytochrome b5, partial [Wolfiporia cocos MD-104 SS10]
YLCSWLFSQDVNATNPSPTIIEPAENTDADDTETIHGGNNNDDTPPSFPSLNSVQCLAPSTQQNVAPRILTDSELMPPPPVPSLAARGPGVASSTGSLAVPLTTVKPPAKPSAKRGKVALAPGHGPLDWANLKKSGHDLRGVDTFLRVTPFMLKQHNSREDAWSAFNDKVYNITPYLPYHPGGKKELMRGAGRDGTLTHAWVNLDYMLDACLVGFLVQDS